MSKPGVAGVSPDPRTLQLTPGQKAALETRIAVLTPLSIVCGVGVLWTLALTADEYAGTYTSTVTTTVATLSLPALYGFSPASGSAGAEGTLVTLTGINFTDATAVAFNGTTAVNMTVVNDTHITVTVPEGATTGKIVVFGPGGTLTSATDFTVNGS